MAVEHDKELVVVDDGSTDGTWERLGEWARNQPAWVTCCRHPQNRGKGAAVRTGLAAKKSGRDGCYIDSCFVHQQNIGSCWGQKDGSFPNCVGWTRNQPGSWRYHYWTAIQSNNASGGLLTPQQAFSRYYFSRGSSVDSMLIDQEPLQANPTCIYTNPH